MKDIDTKISILSNSNRIVAASSADWGTLRQGSSIFIGNDKVPYTMAEAKQFFYIRSFSKVDDQTIKVDDALKNNLLVGDIIDLSYKEFYAVEAELNENAEFDGEKVIEHPSFVEPVKVKTKKGSKNAEIIYGGRSLEKAELDNLKLYYNEFSDRKVDKYEVVNVDMTTSNIILNKNLPAKVKVGKISVQKWEAFLNVNYMGHDKINVSCHIMRDATPNIGFLLVPKFGPAQSAVINENFKRLDLEIQAIKKQIGL